MKLLEGLLSFCSNCGCFVTLNALLVVLSFLGFLAFVVYNCEFITFPLVSWVRYGT